MTARLDVERILDGYLAPDSDRLSDRVLEAALSDIALTPQRRSSLPSAFARPAPGPAAGLFLAAVAALVVLAGVLLSAGGPPAPSPSPTFTAAPSPGLVETSDWIPYTSARYGITLAYPPGWSLVQADHAWTWDVDAKNALSTAQDALIGPDGAIRVGVWTVPLAEELDQTWALHEAWALDYCLRSDSAPCTDLHDRIVPLCIEKRDCHAAVIVRFAQSVQFFGHGGVLGDGMTIVAVWLPEDAPAAATYGGATRLLEGFLSTMEVFPPAFPESQDAAATFLVTGR